AVARAGSTAPCSMRWPACRTGVARSSCSVAASSTATRRSRRPSACRWARSNPKCGAPRCGSEKRWRLISPTPFPSSREALPAIECCSAPRGLRSFILSTASGVLEMGPRTRMTKQSDLLRLIEGECSPEEAAAIQAWVAADPHRGELLDEMRAVWRVSGEGTRDWGFEQARERLLDARNRAARGPGPFPVRSRELSTRGVAGPQNVAARTRWGALAAAGEVWLGGGGGRRLA